MAHISDIVPNNMNSQQNQRRSLLRLAGVSAASSVCGLFGTSCSFEDTQLKLPSISDKSFAFPIPRHVVVSLQKYNTIEEALENEARIDWQRDTKSAESITLAYAAQELQAHLALIGVAASISVSGMAVPANSSFILAITEPAQNHTKPRLDFNKNGELIKDESFEITPVDKHIYVTARNRVGVLNGVYRLLDHIGFAWYDPYETQTPSDFDEIYNFTWKKISEAPRVGLRGFWIYGNGPDDFVPDEFAIWLRRNRFNIGGTPRNHIRNKLGIKVWGGEHNLLQQEFSRPGLFEEHPEWYPLISGVRRPVVETGDYFNPSFANIEACKYFSNRIIDRLQNGDLQNVSVLNVWPSDNRFNNFDQSILAKTLGNESDNLLHFYSVVLKQFKLAYADGRLTRSVVLAGISYYLTMMPPTNKMIISKLEDDGYLHIFYPIDRSWAGEIDSDLMNRHANRKFIQNLAEWKAVAKFNYGVVDYHNVSVFGAIGVSDMQYIHHNYETLIAGSSGLFAYMHPLLKNPGSRRLTNHLFSRLPWLQPSPNQYDGEVNKAKKISDKFFETRYGKWSLRWYEVCELMAHSVENAQEIFGHNSLYWVLFQHFMWDPAFYTSSEATELIARYRAGGRQELPARFSNSETVVETFIGLDESIKLQENARAKWKDILKNVVDERIEARLKSDIDWFSATISRYRLMALTCDYVLSSGSMQGATTLKLQIQREIDFLRTSPVTEDTISPVNQRVFLDYHQRIIASGGFGAQHRRNSQ